ncbi:MAG TPA: aldehyde dehydrogenase family protein [Pseudonocardiaceae bacterium]
MTSTGSSGTTTSRPARWEYDPAPVPAALADVRPNYRPFVDGRFVDGAGEPLHPVNPATEEVLTEVATAGPADVDTAVQAARRALEQGWGSLRGVERARRLHRIAELLQQRSQELAVLESLDSGKPIREATQDVSSAAAHFFHYAGWADKLEYAGYGPNPRPVGVVAQIVPSDLPLLLAARMVAPALACGSSVILKPAASTPLTALVLAEICREAELPAGALNVLPGDGGVGAALAEHPGVDAVAFSGSAEVGRRIRQATAGSDRRLLLELGGAGVNVVFDDAPLDQAVEGVVTGACLHRGQARGAGSRLLVQESIAEELTDRLRTRLATLRVGDPLDPNTELGALGSRRRLDRVRELLANAEAEGARRWSSPYPLPDRGYFLAATMLSDVQQSMRVAREEIRGPVVSVLTFRTPEEAVTKANATPHGLTAGVWTEKGSRALWTAQRLRAGVVWANTFHRLDPTAPVGARRESGFGHQNGPAGLEAYLDA